MVKRLHLWHHLLPTTQRQSHSIFLALFACHHLLLGHCALSHLYFIRLALLANHLSLNLQKLVRVSNQILRLLLELNLKLCLTVKYLFDQILGVRVFTSLLLAQKVTYDFICFVPDRVCLLSGEAFSIEESFVFSVVPLIPKIDLCFFKALIRAIVVWFRIEAWVFP